jgi:hypothetical protein
MKQWEDYEVPARYPRERPRRPADWPGPPAREPLPRLLLAGPGPRRPGLRSWVARNKFFTAAAACGAATVTASLVLSPGPPGPATGSVPASSRASADHSGQVRACVVGDVPGRQVRGGRDSMNAA